MTNKNTKYIYPFVIHGFTRHDKTIDQTHKVANVPSLMIALYEIGIKSKEIFQRSTGWWVEVIVSNKILTNSKLKKLRKTYIALDGVDENLSIGEIKFSEDTKDKFVLLSIKKGKL